MGVNWCEECKDEIGMGGKEICQSCREKEDAATAAMEAERDNLLEALRNLLRDYLMVLNTETLPTNESISEAQSVLNPRN